jgi:cytoskeletal protein CcmA (bactofilin family)
MTERPCVIGSDITIRGNLSGDEDLEVQGRIEGSLTLSRHLTVAPSGALEASLDVADVTVHGALRGDTRASGRAVIGASAQVLGDIEAASVVIEDGARFKGRIEMDFELPESATREG